MVQDSLDKLQTEFSHIMTEIKSIFREKVTNDDKLPTKISDWVEHWIYWEHGTVHNDFDDIFKKIYHHYDFVDCSLIIALCNEFISEEKVLIGKLKVYSSKAIAFRSSTPILEFKQKLCNVYKPYRRHLENMPLIWIKLQNPWNNVKITGLRFLVRNLLPNELRQSIMKCITIEPGSVVIKLHILDSTADSLIEYTGGKSHFMRLIGIISLYINDHPKELYYLKYLSNENINFTFELALLEAVTVGNSEAVEFLLQLETVNIDHTNEEGKTALMLACERGHEDIVHSLLSAGANVNIQDNKGWTALMIASEHNHISIIQMLLQADANPHLIKSNGSNAVMIASYHGNYEVVELLISKGVDYKYQREDGWNAFMLACQNGCTQIVELLLKEQVDPNVQEKDGWNAFMLACQNGCTQIVELLLKEQVDPNVQEKDGWNAFMLACQNGCTQIVELLLKEQVDPNVQEKDGWNAFMLACQNGHTQIVELLLKEQVDPNVQNKHGDTALMLVRHFKVAKLLLEWKADLTIKSNEGYTSSSKPKSIRIQYAFSQVKDDAVTRSLSGIHRTSLWRKILASCSCSCSTLPTSTRNR